MPHRFRAVICLGQERGFSPVWAVAMIVMMMILADGPFSLAGAQDTPIPRHKPISAPPPFTASEPDQSTTVHGPDCTCRAAGIAVPVGQSICLRLPGGGRIATCGMVLNNTSWQIGQTPCPDA